MLGIDIEAVIGETLAGIRADGIAIGVAVGDQVGLACRGRVADQHVDGRCTFYGASVTKQIVGLLSARAIINRAAGADDPLVRWLPDLPDWMAPVRLDHLIHHTSGLPDVTEPDPNVPTSNRDVIERLHRLDPRSVLAPGASYAYGNVGYVLLAEALERIFHQPIGDVARVEFFEPLGLDDTHLGRPAARLPTIADPPGSIGDGGLWTSITDLTGWLQACNSARFGTEVHRQAETTTDLADGTHVDYAWGVRITPCPYGRLITHGGSWQSWQAKTVRIPERGVAVAVLSVGATARIISGAGIQLAEAVASRLSADLLE